MPSAPAALRIGYFSADFHEHATAHLIAELFERHNKAKFELTAYSFGPRVDTPMRRRLMAAFDHFVASQRTGSRNRCSTSRPTHGARARLGHRAGLRPDHLYVDA